MTEDDENVDPMELFKEETEDLDLQVQLRALEKMATVAVALDVERTRSELIPYLELFLDTNFLHDELHLALARHLEYFVPFVGGPNYAELVLSLLEKLCNIDEPSVREQAVKSMVNIASTLDGKALENSLFPIINDLANGDWFTTKSCAAGLLAVCYPKVSEEHKIALKDIFCKLIQDQQPIVRRAVTTHFAEFANVLDVDDLKSEFLRILDYLIKESQDTVRLTAVDLIIGIAKRLTEAEIEELILPKFQELADDTSWKVRCNVVYSTPLVQQAVGLKLTQKYLIPIYQTLCKDSDHPVREEATKNILQFCLNLKAQFEESGDLHNFEGVFNGEMLPLIKQLYEDSNDNIRTTTAKYIFKLLSLINSEGINKEFIPIIIHSLENEQCTFKENIARNLDSLVKIMSDSDLSESIQQIIEDLIYKSDSKWRMRRDVLLGLLQVCKQCDKEFFDEHLKDFYFKLLCDPVFAVRKTAALLLPLLTKRFGVSWACSVVPVIMAFRQERNYLYRYIPLFNLDEMMDPSLDHYKLSGKPITYLSTLQELCYHDDQDIRQKAIRILTRTVILQEILNQALKEEWVQHYLTLIETEEYRYEKTSIYAEETLNSITENESFSVTDINEHDLQSQEENKTYLEGILHMCIKYFLNTIEELLKDKVANIPVRAKHSLLRILQISRNLNAECNEAWVKDLISTVDKNDIDDIMESIKSRLSMISTPAVAEVVLNFELSTPGKDVSLPSPLLENVETKIVEEEANQKGSSENLGKETPETPEKQEEEMKDLPANDVEETKQVNATETKEILTTSDATENKNAVGTHENEEIKTEISTNVVTNDALENKNAVEVDRKEVLEAERSTDTDDAKSVLSATEQLKTLDIANSDA